MARCGVCEGSLDAPTTYARATFVASRSQVSFSDAVAPLVAKTTAFVWELNIQAAYAVSLNTV